MKKLAIFLTVLTLPLYAFSSDGHEEKGYFTTAKEFLLTNFHQFDKTWQINSNALHYFFNRSWAVSCGHRKFGKWFQSTEKEKVLASQPYTIKPKCFHSLDFGVYMKQSNFSFGFFGGTGIEGYLPFKRAEPLDSLVYSGVKAFVEF